MPAALITSSPAVAVTIAITLCF